MIGLDSAYPAYGRWYASKGPLQADWEAGKDFRLANGQYFSIRDLPRMAGMGIRQVTIYNGPLRTWQIVVKTGA